MNRSGSFGAHVRGRSWLTAWRLACASVAVVASICRGELTVIENADDQAGLTVFKMTVDPAAEPEPALKYRLTLREREYKPGNAAMHYARAFPEGGVAATWKLLEKEYGMDEVHQWYDVSIPIADLPMEKARQAASHFQGLVEHFVAPGSERCDCDWGHGIITELRGPDVYEFLLPEIQSMRSIGRAMTLCTRVAVADRDYERAIDLLRMNYRLGENVARSPFLVSGLVGLAICGMGNMELIELIAAPDSPNLYWAIAELPQPLVDLRTAVRQEFSLHVAVFPFMDQPEKVNHTPQEWTRLITESLQSLGPLTGTGMELDAVTAQASVTGLALVSYGPAKQRLLAQGMSPSQVEAMPVGQVIAVDAEREYRRIADELEKWWYVSYRQAKGLANDVEDSMPRNPLDGNFGGTLAKLLLPAVEATRNAQMRTAWQLAAIQTIEAIRMHAVETGGLPASLEEITVVPVPENPATGKPYQYRLDGDTAVLELPFSDGFPGTAWRFEIKLAR